MLTITWLGHACFLLEYRGFRILLDPYQDVPGLPNTAVEADAVYCSHDHFDHCYTEHVTLTGNKENPFTVREVPCFHDPEQGALRGPNTIRLFTAGGLTVAHMGDLGHFLSEEQAREMGHCDAMLMPIGGVYTLDAAQAREQAARLNPTVLIPMHYHKGPVGFDNIGTLEDFTALFPADQVQTYDTNRLVLTPETPKQVAVLALPEF